MSSSLLLSRSAYEFITDSTREGSCSFGVVMPVIRSSEPPRAIVIRAIVSNCGFGVEPLKILVTVASGTAEISAISALVRPFSSFKVFKRFKYSIFVLPLSFMSGFIHS